jgi:hypothetical protein
MNDMEPDQRSRIKNLPWICFFVFLFIQSLAVIYWTVSLPGDPRNSLIFGMSPARFALMLGILIPGLVFAAAAFVSGVQKSAIRDIFEERWREDNNFLWFEGLAVLISLISWGYLVYLRSGVDGAENPLYIRFLPFLLWVIVLGFQFVIWLWYQCYGWNFAYLLRFKPAFIATAIVAAVFLILALIMAFTGWGIKPDIFFWGNPGVPLLAWQVWLSLGSGLALLTLLVTFPVIRSYTKRLDWIIGGGLFLLAVTLWLTQPIPRSFFFPAPRAPGFQIYPYSDAGFYDYSAQTLLVGEGFLNGEIVTRPVYILFLAVLHGMEGQNYVELITLQTFILAVFPAALYWLGRSMRSREAGLAAGLLAIFRELNAFAATPLTEVSHSKMLMTDSMTGLGICLFCLAVFRWLRKTEVRPVRAVLVGGFLGMLMLLRSQAAFFFPVVLLFLILQRKLGWKDIIRECAFFTLGMVLALSPWIIRNGIRTGDFALDQPSQAAIMAQRYASSVEEAQNTLLTSKTGEVSAHIIQYTLAHPLDVAGFISAHFMNNELATLEALPLRLSFTDYHDNFQISTLFWLDGINGISGWQWVLLVINLLLISIGIGSAWAKWQWGGLLPLTLQVSYSLSSAFGRISGWRFIQPVDWVGYFYFCLGFAEICVWLFAASGLSLRPREKNTRELPPLRVVSPAWISASAGAILLTGFLLPLAELIIPPRYTVEVQKQAIQTADKSPLRGQAIGSSDDFLKQKLAVRMVGRALYPRWYKAGGGEPGNGWAAYKPRPDGHLGFMMVGPYGEQQMVLTIAQSPEKFPHASDVIVYGCRKSGYIDVRLVVGYNEPDMFEYSSGNPSTQCDPLP